jgi:two-component system, chemotaxis family, protein-glutamate methylesterase/glutaminase
VKPRHSPVRVLVVDDSAVVRQVLTTLLERDGDIAVTTAADPLIARGKMDRSPPDVLLLDIEMPRMDGLQFLREIMAKRPMPVVICSSHVARGTRRALEAMALGAVEIILKPETRVREFLEESRITISDVVRAAACARMRARPSAESASRLWADDRPPRAIAVKPAGPTAGEREPMVAIGASTGGPGALAKVLGDLPHEAPPILIVQHMPRTFTGPFAEQLDRIARVEVRQAVDGDLLRRGLALVAPGGQHMMLERGRHGYHVRILDGPLVSRHRPSVDVLFTSVAEHAHPESLGVILTGMGDDGVAGLLRMRAAGMLTIAQEESSCAVFGMPREAIARSAVDHVLPLGEISKTIEARSPTSGSGWSTAFTPEERKIRRQLLTAKGAGRWRTLDP